MFVNHSSGTRANSRRALAIAVVLALVLAACGGSAPQSVAARGSAAIVEPGTAGQNGDAQGSAAAEACQLAAANYEASDIGVFVRAESTTWLDVSAMLEIEIYQGRDPAELVSVVPGDGGAAYLQARQRRPDEAITVCVFADGTYSPPGDGARAARPPTARMFVQSGGLEVLSLPPRPASEPMMPSEYSDELDETLRDAIRVQYDAPIIDAPPEFDVEPEGLKPGG